MLPFIKLCRNSAKRWIEISDYLMSFKLPNKTKNAYILIKNKIETLTDSERYPAGKIKTRQEALKHFKIRLSRHNKYKKRIENGVSFGKKMICPECRSQSYDLSKFNKHLGNLKKKMCGVCYEIVDVTSYRDHCISHNLNIYSCRICFETFEKKSYYIIHQIKHKNGAVSCVECHKTFKNSVNLNTHMNKHSPITCACGKWLSNRTCYFNHKKKCSQYKKTKSKYICDHCNKEYSKKNCLRMHMKYSHIVGWLFQCEKCGKKLSSRAHLVEHENTHEKILDRYVCYCGAKFSSRRGYQKHSKKHASTIDGDKYGWVLSTKLR